MTHLIQALRDPAGWQLARTLDGGRMVLDHALGPRIRVSPSRHKWALDSVSSPDMDGSQEWDWRFLIDIARTGTGQDLDAFRSDLIRVFGVLAQEALQDLSKAIWRWVLGHHDPLLDQDLHLCRVSQEILVLSTNTVLAVPASLHARLLATRDIPHLIQGCAPSGHPGLSYDTMRLPAPASLHARLQLLEAPLST